MNSGYDAGTWTAMYGAVAAAAAAFAVLLFVALTMNLPRILPDAGHVARAREALAGLLSPLVMALLVLIPSRPHAALGIELLGLAAVVVAFSIRYQRQTIRRLPPGRRARWAARMLPVNAGTATMIVAGASLRQRPGRPVLAGGDRGDLRAAIGAGRMGTAD
jgi:hypothetical protein